MVALRLATELRALGNSGNGGGFDVDVVVVAVEAAGVAAEPVRPTEALVAPPLRSQGFGGEGVAIYSLCVDAGSPCRHQGLRAPSMAGAERGFCVGVTGDVKWRKIWLVGRGRASLRGSPGW